MVDLSVNVVGNRLRFYAYARRDWAFYTVSAPDVLWLLRAVEVEGAVQTEVAQTLVNCFCLLRQASDRYPTLLSFVRAYAQPVNSRWFPYGPKQGDLHAKWLARGKDTVESAERREKVHSRRTKFTQATEHAVRKALTLGSVDILPNCTDYAAAWIDASHKYRPLTDAVKGRNRLWSRDVRWGGYSVVVKGSLPQP